MNKRKVEIDGKEVEITYEKVGNTLWVHCNGQTYDFEVQKRAGKKNQGVGASLPGQIVAPMPGKIMKVFCQPGDSVAAGDDILAMEAMKMEYVLKSDIDGLVQPFQLEEGEQVALGQLLVAIQGEGVDGE